MNASTDLLVPTFAEDINGTRLYPGDTIRTHVGECVIKRFTGHDNLAGHGAVAMVLNAKGQNIELRLLIAGAVLVREHSAKR